jgi:hypothetical protein
MVSKRAVEAQKEVTEQYKVPIINPASSQYFDRQYRFKVTAKTLQDRLERIQRLVCPEEEKPKAEGEGAEGTGEAAKPAAGAEGAEGAEAKEAPAEEKPAPKKTTPKKTTKKKTTK